MALAGRCLTIILAVSAACCTCTQLLISSDFLWDHDGWTVTTDPRGRPAGDLMSLTQAAMMLKAGDSGPKVWYFVAPEKFLGDQSRMLGGELAYRIGFVDYQGEWKGAEGLAYDVELASDKYGMVLGRRGLVLPRAFIASVKVTLCAECGWEVVGTGGGVSSFDFERVVSALSSLRIRGGFYSGPEDTFLMTVRLTPPSSTNTHTHSTHSNSAAPTGKHTRTSRTNDGGSPAVGDDTKARTLPSGGTPNGASDAHMKAHGIGSSGSHDDTRDKDTHARDKDSRARGKASRARDKDSRTRAHPGEAELRGSEGVLGLNDTHVYYMPYKQGAGARESAVVFRDISSVHVDDDGLITVVTAAQGTVQCGPLRGYGDVSAVARLLEEAKRRTDAARVPDAARGGMHVLPGRGAAEQIEHGSAGGKGAAAARETGRVGRGNEQAASEKGKAAEAQGAGRRAGRGAEIVSMSQQVRSLVRREEERLRLNTATMLRRVEGSSSAVILTADGITHIETHPRVRSKSVPLNTLTIMRKPGVVVLGGGAAGEDMAVTLAEYPFQALMELIDEASKLMGLR